MPSSQVAGKLKEMRCQGFTLGLTTDYKCGGGGKPSSNRALAHRACLSCLEPQRVISKALGSRSIQRGACTSVALCPKGTSKGLVSESLKVICLAGPPRYDSSMVTELHREACPPSQRPRARIPRLPPRSAKAAGALAEASASLRSRRGPLECLWSL